MTFAAAVAGRPLIAHVVHRFAMGGMENGVVNLINGMDRRFAHAIVCLDSYTDFSRRLQPDDVRLIALHKRPGHDLPHYGRLRRAFRELRPTVVHTRNVGALEAGLVARLTGVRHVVHGEHGFDVDDLNGGNRRYRLLRRVGNPFIRRFVCVSRQIARWLRDDVGLPARKLVQIYNGVDSARFTPAGRDAARARLAAAGVQSPFIAGYVGRLETVKNPLALVTACAAQAQRDSEFAGQAALVLVGDGSLAAELASAAQRQTGMRIHLLGARDDVAELMPGFDVFTLPSLNEGISNTVLEAMASGVPVVASRVGGSPELVEDGRSGLLYECDDLAALGAHVASYLHDPAMRAAHAAAARARALERFSLRRMISDYENVYGEFC